MPTIGVRDTNLFYQERGSGPLAVFLHGFMMDHTLWLDQIANLADKRRCVTIDQRGFGRSDPITVEVLDLDDYADDVDVLIGALGEEKADLVGFSLGGTIALKVWERHPERVRSLSILSTGFGPAPGAPPPPPREPGSQGTVEYLRNNARKAVFEGKQGLFLQFNDYIFGPA
jgi:pimeloyl-ACP methyl ester carboxylesterase